MSEIKRVWSDKKTTWNNKEQVWDKDWELKVYDGQWKDVDGDIEVYKCSQFETLPWNAELDVYDTNDPTFIGTVEDWINAAYVFKDWDGTVLKSWKVKDGWTPTPPANPTRSGYEFTGWKPTVEPIYKSTEYIAQYELVSSIVINEELSTTNVEVWSTFKCYFTCPNAVTFSDNTMWLKDTSSTIEWEYKVYTWTVISVWAYTLTITDNVTWDSGSIGVTCSSPLIVHYNLWNGSTSAVESDYPSLTSHNATQWPASDVPCTWFWNDKYMYTNNLFDGQGFSGNEDFTISFWTNPTSFTEGDGYYNFISIGAIWDYSNICLFWHSWEFYYGWYQNDTATWVAINTGEWTHIAMTYNSSDRTTTVYQNGVKQYEGTANYNIANGWHLVIWAGLSHNNGQLDGYMNEVLIAKQIYSDQDIADIYSKGLGSHTYIWINDIYTNSIYVWDSDQLVMDFNYSTMANDITDVVYVIDEPWVATWRVVDQWSDLANLEVSWLWATNDAVIQVVTHWTNEVTGLASICSWILTHLQIEIPPIQSISSLSADSVSIFEQQLDSSITFSYTPTISTDDSNVSYDTTDSSVAYIEGISYEGWTATVNIQAWNTWTCTLSISCWIDTLSLSVTVNPYVVTSVSNLSASSITLETGQQDDSITFEYSPADADVSNITIVSTDDSIAAATLRDEGDGEMVVDIDTNADWTATLDIQLDGVSTWLTITVTAQTPGE